MANPGMLTSYELTTGVIVDMSETLYLVDPVDVPILGGMSGAGISLVGQDTSRQKKFEWQDDFILTPRSTLATNVTTGTTFITVASGDQINFSTGDILLVEAEYVRVTGYGSTTDTLDVTRAYESASTAVNHATSVDVICVGTALAEGSDPQNARAVDRSSRYNVMQIFGPTAINMSETDMVVPRYGVPNEWNHQLMKRIQEHWIRAEQSFVYGVRTESTTTRIRTTGGSLYWITTANGAAVDSTTTSMSVSAIQSAQQTNFNNGGVPEILVANPSNLKMLTDVTNTSIVRVTRDESRRGRPPALWVDTEFGSVTLVRNRWFRTGDAVLYRRDGVTKVNMRPLVFEMLAKTGDSRKGQIVAEFGWKFEGIQHMARFSALTGA